MAGRDPGGRGYLGVTRRPTRREWRRSLLFFAAGTVGLVLVLLLIRPQANLLAVGSRAPAVSLDAAGGGHVDVAAAAAGRPYVLEFFEASCAHCQQVAGGLCQQPLPVFAVDAARESSATVTQYRREYAPRCAYPVLLDPNLTATGAYAVNAVPTVYIVRSGRIAFAGAGLDGANALHAAAEKLAGG